MPTSIRAANETKRDGLDLQRNSGTVTKYYTKRSPNTCQLPTPIGHQGFIKSVHWNSLASRVSALENGLERSIEWSRELFLPLFYRSTLSESPVIAKATLLATYTVTFDP